MKTNQNVETDSSPVNVGQRLRELRTEKGISIRRLASTSGLNVNTLSLIENGKTSPSVSTLQQIAAAMQIPITAFFASVLPPQKVVYQLADERKLVSFSHGTLADLATNFTRPALAPFMVTLQVGSDSGSSPIVHTGVEFVYCLEGEIEYSVNGETFVLHAGDSLVFEAHLPHRWRNPGHIPARSLLLICSADERENPDRFHFS